jgi:hypothetical protein
MFIHRCHCNITVLEIMYFWRDCKPLHIIIGLKIQVLNRHAEVFIIAVQLGIPFFLSLICLVHNLCEIRVLPWLLLIAVCSFHLMHSELTNGIQKWSKTYVRDLHINNQQNASSIQNFILSWNSTCFGHLLCPSSGVIGRTRGSWYISCRLWWLLLGQSGWSSSLTVLGSGHITCMKHTNCHVYSW